MDQLGQTAIRYPSFGVIKKGGVWMIWAHLWQRRLLKDDDFSVVDDKLVSSSLYLVRSGNADTRWGEDWRWKLWDCWLTMTMLLEGTDYLLTQQSTLAKTIQREEESLCTNCSLFSVWVWAIGLSSFRLNGHSASYNLRQRSLRAFLFKRTLIPPFAQKTRFMFL